LSRDSGLGIRGLPMEVDPFRLRAKRFGDSPQPWRERLALLCQIQIFRTNAIKISYCTNDSGFFTIACVTEAQTPAQCCDASVRLPIQFASCFGRDCAARRRESLPGGFGQRQRAQVHAGDAWALERCGVLSSAAALHHAFAVGRGPVWARLHALIPDRGGILAVDDTGFPQQGPALGRRQTAVLRGARKTGNCQVGVRPR